jgi:hypothetical protein
LYIILYICARRRNRSWSSIVTSNIALDQANRQASCLLQEHAKAKQIYCMKIRKTLTNSCSTKWLVHCGSNLHWYCWALAMAISVLEQVKLMVVPVFPNCAMCNSKELVEFWWILLGQYPATLHVESWLCRGTLACRCRWAKRKVTSNDARRTACIEMTLGTR